MGAGIVYTIVCCPAIRPRHAPGIRERAVARMRFGCGVGDSSFLVGGGGGGRDGMNARISAPSACRRTFLSVARHEMRPEGCVGKIASRTPGPHPHEEDDPCFEC